MANLQNSKILLTGGSGFLGQNVLTELLKEGIPHESIIIPRSKTNDLRKYETCLDLTKNIDIVIHLAAHVGGIGLNKEKPAELFYDNLIMGTQLIHAAHLNCVNKFVCVGTVCAYPKFCPVPFKEEDIWNGYPEETNAPYGIAKKALLAQLQAYRQQYNFNGIYLLPVNLYGPNDNFDLNTSHVIPAIINKIYLAKKNNSNVILWGNGSASREFLYVRDAARAIVAATKNYNDGEPVNVGTNKEITIYNLVKLICKLMSYEGTIIWDESKPNGQPRRCLDITRASSFFTPQVDLENGLSHTVEWFLRNNS